MDSHQKKQKDKETIKLLQTHSYVTHKSYITLFQIIILIIGVTIFTQSCGDSPPQPTLLDTQFKKLKGIWVVSRGTLENENIPDYESFTISIEGNSPNLITYKTSNGPKISTWPANGTLTFDNADISNTLIRDKGTGNELKLSYAVSEGLLVISYEISSEGGGGSIGEWRLTLKK